MDKYSLLFITYKSLKLYTISMSGVVERSGLRTNILWGRYLLHYTAPSKIRLFAPYYQISPVCYNRFDMDCREPTTERIENNQLKCNKRLEKHGRVVILLHNSEDLNTQNTIPARRLGCSFSKSMGTIENV